MDLESESDARDTSENKSRKKYKLMEQERYEHK